MAKQHVKFKTVSILMGTKNINIPRKSMKAALPCLYSAALLRNDDEDLTK